MTYSNFARQKYLRNKAGRLERVAVRGIIDEAPAELAPSDRDMCDLQILDFAQLAPIGSIGY